MGNNALEGGLFIVIEGIDGAGKSSQVTFLAESLSREGYRVVTTREPTDGIWGRKIRNLYKDSERANVTAEDEVDLFVRDRQEDVDRTIRPGLDRGCIVLSDRYFYSNIAYQGARGVSPEIIRSRNRDFPVPDLVILIDLDPETGISRITRGRGEQTNSFERSDGLTTVRAIFLSLPDDNIVRIDGTQPAELVSDRILTAIRACIAAKRQARTCRCRGHSDTDQKNESHRKPAHESESTS